PVPAERRGRPGVHRHRVHAPTHAASGSAMAPATSAQYPHAAQPKTIDTVTEVARATRSLTDTRENRMARLRSARCMTETLERRIVADMATATLATLGSP